MILWLDAQLPPGIARWISATFGITAVPLREIGLRDATDLSIFEAARSARATIISKDSDFVALVERLGPPPQLIWLTCGNVSNKSLRRLLLAALPAAISLLDNDTPIVEVGDR